MSTTSISNNTTEAVSAVQPSGMRAIHPGEVLEEILEEGLRITVKDAAGRLRVSRQTLHRIISCKAAVTADMALRLGKLCGNGAHLWLAMQSQYDLAVKRAELEGELALIPGPEERAI